MNRTLRFSAGLLLLPFIWAEGVALLSLLPDAYATDFPYVSWEILAFIGGMALWCAIALRIGGGGWLYVFGHELTHAAWALMTFTKVSKIHVTRRGGYCLISNPGPLTTLAPYFVPFYVVVLLLVRLALGHWFDMAPWARWWIGALGFAYGFHVTNTIESLVKVAQPDIREYGRLFSCVLIVVANMLFLGLGMAVMLGSPLRGWLMGLWGATADAYCATWRFAVWAAMSAFSFAKGVLGK